MDRGRLELPASCCFGKGVITPFHAKQAFCQLNYRPAVRALRSFPRRIQISRVRATLGTVLIITTLTAVVTFSVHSVLHTMCWYYLNVSILHARFRISTLLRRAATLQSNLQRVRRRLIRQKRSSVRTCLFHLYTFR